MKTTTTTACYLALVLGLSALLLLSTVNAFVIPAAAARSGGVQHHQQQRHVAATATHYNVAFVCPTTTTTATRAEAVVGPRHFRRASSRLFMGWGPDPIWDTAKVVSNEAACPSEACVSILVDVGAEKASEYKVPGQYVQVRLNEDTKPLFLAIASAPSSSNNDENDTAAATTSFEFLVKKTDGNEWATSLKANDALEVSQVLGNGFAMQENLDGFKYDFPTQNVLLFAAGSGIAPIKAAMESGALGTSGGRTARLYYGERTPDDLCFASLYKTWESAGIQVVPVLSQPPGSWQGRSGYVQNALEEDGVPIPRNCGALLCGQKGMAESVTDTLTKAGVFEGRILTNF